MIKTFKWIMVGLFSLSVFYFAFSIYNSNYDSFLWSSNSKILFIIIVFVIVIGVHNNIVDETNIENYKNKKK